ncbi:hypothetical protein MNB_SV-14-173 [hydrothermal vent metagenome]|uniref:Uncharacterized protein n=1 Tax=hydrothermal vent metagenome TaxID=652676 RepID=A0A1W1BY60_9ZZZZ
MTDQKDLKKYINTKKSSKLLPYKDNIKYLLDNNASQVAILRYLDEKENITVTRPTLSNFIKKYIKKTPYTPKEKSDKSNNKKDEKNQDKPQKLKDSIFDD